MRLDEQMILSLSGDLWASLLGLQVREEERAPGPSRERTWASCITVSGPWQGAIVVECPDSIARHAAAMLCSADGESASEQDRADALKELAAMIGSRMRQALPEASQFSQPAILTEGEPAAGLAGLRDVGELKLSCEGRPVRIAVLEAQPIPVEAD